MNFDSQLSAGGLSSAITSTFDIQDKALALNQSFQSSEIRQIQQSLLSNTGF
jgi:hypothetical protein